MAFQDIGLIPGLYSMVATIEGLHERTEHLDIFLFFRPSLNGGR